MTVGEPRHKLRTLSEPERLHLLGCVLREAPRHRSVELHGAPGIAPARFGANIAAPPQEILANKLCNLLSRSAPRDLMDLFALDRAEFRVEEAVPLARRKGATFTPAQLR